MNTFVQKYKLPLVAVAALGLVFGWNTFRPSSNQATPVSLLELSEPTEALVTDATDIPAEPDATVIQATPTLSIIAVYVSGAVVKPGVYRLYDGARIDDAIRMAGGMSDNADPIRINLAARVYDEQQIYVLQRGEQPPDFIAQRQSTAAPVAETANAQSPAPAASASNGKINLNTATLDQLDTLPRIGPATAQRIIDYRTQNGNFKTIEDLQNVKGIGAATFADLKDLITVGD